MITLKHVVATLSCVALLSSGATAPMVARVTPNTFLCAVFHLSC